MLLRLYTCVLGPVNPSFLAYLLPQVTGDLSSISGRWRFLTGDSRLLCFDQCAAVSSNGTEQICQSMSMGNFAISYRFSYSQDN